MEREEVTDKSSNAYKTTLRRIRRSPIDKLQPLQQDNQSLIFQQDGPKTKHDKDFHQEEYQGI